MHTIELELEDELLLKLCLMAHKADITLNQFLINLLQEAVEQWEKDAD